MLYQANKTITKGSRKN